MTRPLRMRLVMKATSPKKVKVKESVGDLFKTQKGPTPDEISLKRAVRRKVKGHKYYEINPESNAKFQEQFRQYAKAKYTEVSDVFIDKCDLLLRNASVQLQSAIEECWKSK